MGLLLLIPGLILMLNGVEWFPAEDTVGLILTCIGGGLLLLQVVIMAIAAVGVNAARKRF